jgi:hypothetical protein
MEITQPGLIEDPRSELEKSQDYQHQEVAPMGVVLQWNRDISEAPTYSQRDQDGSGSCVSQGSAKGLETERKEVISAHPIYARRANAPGEGMWLQNAGDIVKKLGTTTEALDPSQKMTEQQMDAPVTLDTPINNYLYAFPNIKNIDEVAQAIELHGHCVVTVGCDGAEWTEKPVYNGSNNLNFFHAICATYYFTDENGKKCLRIDESWGVNNPGHRVLTEDFLLARGTGAMYFIPPVVPPTPVKPQFHFTVPLLFGQNSYGIKELQDILKYESLFPINVPSTGYYGAITAKAVIAWQLKHEVDTPEVLNALKGQRVGLKTIAKLNSLYN